MRSLLHILLFLIGLIGTAHWIRSLDEVPFDSYTVASTLRCYETQADEIDTIFIGSSRMLRAVRPQTFDATMTELGHPTRSFNLAFAGLQAHDFDAILDFVLSRRPPALKTMIVELVNWQKGDRPHEWMTRQVIDVHTLSSVPSRIMTALDRDDGLEAQLNSIGWTIAHAAVRALNIGQGARILNAILRPRPIPSLLERGWSSFEDDDLTPARRQRNQSWLASPQRAAKLRALRANSIRSKRPERGLRPDAVQARAERIRAAGITPIFVVLPANEWFFARNQVDELPKELTVLTLDDPEEHPDLYEHERWFDKSHVNGEGAKLFSRRLAEAIADR
ncbi:MAG: hypothetical protein KAI24_24100 [Planctomycetes bacterium]|nr:hypothetical protein [Planctomycetota bacterium]